MSTLYLHRKKDRSILRNSSLKIVIDNNNEFELGSDDHTDIELENGSHIISYIITLSLMGEVLTKEKNETILLDSDGEIEISFDRKGIVTKYSNDNAVLSTDENDNFQDTKLIKLSYISKRFLFSFFSTSLLLLIPVGLMIFDDSLENFGIVFIILSFAFIISPTILISIIGSKCGEKKLYPKTFIIYLIIALVVVVLISLLVNPIDPSQQSCGHPGCEENGPFPCYGKNNTCPNYTDCYKDLYCDQCD